MSTTELQQPVQLTWYGRAGDWAKKNQGDIVLVIGFILVAIISFGAGYLSVPIAKKLPIVIENGQKDVVSKQVTSEQGKIGEAPNVNAVISAGVISGNNSQGIIVASKNSTIYHWPWCAAAKRIKPENQVWFKSEAEAQAAGFKKCADFDKSAPAGYKSQ